ncbi:hypothetical protein LEP1GSC062_1664 [Leptospira alexanderi serovar Manhao 3 str. L 60]|uniref:Uncharacterized protein n=1 Tax=Leptospira alexanderi serovar Manhao 3 str. L 60 TaxID=1049759 RepID=V6HT75_9LEPT|nr:hypothetical protein LEP1GSC062_1664 [Leptospira alexanderi serovar Manhao 3 str. L 60]
MRSGLFFEEFEYDNRIEDFCSKWGKREADFNGIAYKKLRRLFLLINSKSGELISEVTIALFL